MWPNVVVVVGGIVTTCIAAYMAYRTSKATAERDRETHAESHSIEVLKEVRAELDLVRQEVRVLKQERDNDRKITHLAGDFIDSLGWWFWRMVSLNPQTFQTHPPPVPSDELHGLVNPEPWRSLTPHDTQGGTHA